MRRCRGGSPEALPPSTLVIPTRNRPSLLLAFVESILRGAEVPSEILIVDQSDDPGPPVELDGRRCVVRHLFVRSSGLARARNQGAAAAAHEIVAFGDDDMIAAPAWYGTLVPSPRERRRARRRDRAGAGRTR